ncbi:MAG TPA: hypothetical protein VF171_06515 [Trueperaceae bacterium]
MIYTAFDPKEVTGEVLLKDRQLMELWKWAADDGQIEAVSIGGKNYVVVKDDDLVRRISEAAGQLQHHQYDEEARALV